MSAETNDPPATPVVCARCGATLVEGFAFCESCGTPTGAAAGVTHEVAGAAVGDELSARTTLFVHPNDEPTASVDVGAEADELTTRCSCGGHFEQGWCDTCGAPRPDERDHVVVSVSASLACVSDRGVVHHRNEDAGTVVDLRGPMGLVVADGVSSAEGSQAAAASAVEATAVALAACAEGDPPDEDWIAVLRRARAEAARAASSPEVRGAGDAPSCTWVAAIADGTGVWVAWVGDSRAYLVDDRGHGLRLTSDHSWAAEAIAAGADHDAAMADSRAHMITAWLGSDAPELPDATAHSPVEASGWLLVVSDGLWNYCDDADDLAALVDRLGGPSLTATGAGRSPRRVRQRRRRGRQRDDLRRPAQRAPTDR